MIDEEILAAFREEARELLDELETVLLELEKNPSDDTLVARTYRVIHTIKGNGAMIGFKDIESLAHELEKVFDRLRSHEVRISKELIDLTLEARDEFFAMLQGEGQAPESERGRALLDAIPALLQSSGEDEEKESLPVRAAEEKGILEILIERGHMKREDLDVILRELQPREALSKEHSSIAAQESSRNIQERGVEEDRRATIRVQARKLDSMVDLVGELVTVQARLSRLSKLGAEGREEELMSVAEEVEHLTWELRDSSFGMRMVPIGTVFSKFRRLVRDLSLEMGRDAELVTEGAETELDKTVIEKLKDPLMHLIRNSIDHGIEPVEARIEAGKPGTGKVRLAASQSGADILIEIADDGAGLDVEVIRKKALEQGLVEADAHLSPKEIKELLFLPGFSTSGTVTSLSGRGVGMDVVKTAIDVLHGRVEIESEKGKGTSMLIRLPLTLAIIEGLEVVIGKEHFILPLSYVEECVELSRRNEEKGKGSRLTHVRGELVPYVPLREWFRVQGDSPEIEQVVITRTDGQRVGLVVDGVVGECQAVIKSLGKLFKKADGFSGATILGDGSVALILDVPHLVRDAEYDEASRSGKKPI